MKLMIIQVIVGVIGITTKGLKKVLKTMPGKHSLDTLQKTAILETSHIIRKVLLFEP
jgi:hypothetical protein